MKEEQHEERATKKKVQHENRATRKKCNINRVQLEDSAPWKKRSTKRAQQGKSAT